MATQFFGGPLDGLKIDTSPDPDEYVYLETPAERRTRGSNALARLLNRLFFQSRDNARLTLYGSYRLDRHQAEWRYVYIGSSHELLIRSAGGAGQRIRMKAIES